MHIFVMNTAVMLRNKIFVAEVNQLQIQPTTKPRKAVHLMRDRLIELLNKKYDHFCDQCGINKDSRYTENLADYLLANGVVVPLLQTGQIVYRVSQGRMWEVKIWKIEICGKTVSYIDNYDKSFLSTHIGKGVFLTKEEAEQALKGGEKK